MKLNHHPEPELRQLSPDDAPSILLDPARTLADFGEISFTPLDEIIAARWSIGKPAGSKAAIHILTVARIPSFEPACAC